VLWPRERNFAIRAKVSPRWAIGEVTKALEDGDVENARGLARRLLPFWTEVANRETRAGFLERMMTMAGRLDSAELAASILKPFALERLAPRAALRLVALSKLYGVEMSPAFLLCSVTPGSVTARPLHV
jgi:hypothetical protein